jgi:outer membrane lipoprotein SlyB
MIKVANNLNTICLVKFAKSTENANYDDLKEKKKRKVNYLRRALTGAAMGGISGAALGSGLTILEPSGILSNNIPVILARGLGAGGLGALLGAGSNMLQGLREADVITRQSKPNRLRRGLIGALSGAAGGLMMANAYQRARTARTNLATLLGGGIAGAATGGLTGAYIYPWMNKDMWDQPDTE